MTLLSNAIQFDGNHQRIVFPPTRWNQQTVTRRPHVQNPNVVRRRPTKAGTLQLTACGRARLTDRSINCTGSPASADFASLVSVGPPANNLAGRSYCRCQDAVRVQRNFRSAAGTWVAGASSAPLPPWPVTVEIVMIATIKEPVQAFQSPLEGRKV